VWTHSFANSLLGGKGTGRSFSMDVEVECVGVLNLGRGCTAHARERFLDLSFTSSSRGKEKNKHPRKESPHRSVSCGKKNSPIRDSQPNEGSETVG